MKQDRDKLGIALVGLGEYAIGQLAPALQTTKECYLAGLVSGSAEKANAIKEQYNLPAQNIYSYENFDAVKDNPAIDIVYVTVPNHLHAEYTIRAAAAGKHVICEKPMAITVADCDRMIEACKQAGTMLSIDYRLHFDPYHLELARLGQQKVYGDIKSLVAEFGQVSANEGWRLDKKIAGGGALMDLGIYCLQAVMYITGMEPVAVTARALPVSDTTKFIDIEDAIEWQMEMPDGLIARCWTSFSADRNIVKVEAANGWFELDPAFNYSGIMGKTSDGILDFAASSQQAKQMDAFARAIKNNQPSIVPGEMGRRDVKIIQAIYEAARSGQRVIV